MAIKEIECRRYQLVIHTEGEVVVTNTDDMVEGRMGFIQGPSPHEGALVLKIYGGLVNLNNPTEVWRSSTFPVRLLRRTDAVTLIVR